MQCQARARCFIVIAAAICATFIVTSTAVAVQDVQLTTVRGDASIADSALTARGELPEGQELQTGEDGNVSVLVDRNAVVELCGQSRVHFGRGASTGTRIINISAGEVKLIVEPREVGERIEIHTPAAIATILGTVVYVSVDPITGATTISSSESQVNIRSKGDAQDAGTTISAYEQLEVVPGQGKQEKRAVTPKQIKAMTSCLLDFHDMAVEIDRMPGESRAVERVAAVDIDAPPPVSAGPVGRASVPGVGQEAPPVELNPTDTNDMDDMPMDENPMENPNPDDFPIPGEQDR